MEPWKRVVESVHRVGGIFFAQLYHAGRAAHPDHIGGVLPLAPSPIKINDYIWVGTEKKELVVPREMTLDDIHRVINDFRKAAEFAKECGFDGVQLHSANGYILDQFLRPFTNKREDDYGGSLEKRCRFLLEVLD
jgi:N-ethylmaleimide reductase